MCKTTSYLYHSRGRLCCRGKMASEYLRLSINTCVRQLHIYIIREDGYAAEEKWLLYLSSTASCMNHFLYLRAKRSPVPRRIQQTTLGLLSPPDINMVRTLKSGDQHLYLKICHLFKDCRLVIVNKTCADWNCISSQPIKKSSLSKES